MKKNTNKPGVIVIGGHIQGLGIIRSLGRKGVPVYLLDDKPICVGRFSRYCKKFIKTPKINAETEFILFLKKIAIDSNLKGCILIPTNDAAVCILSKYKQSLEEFYKVPTPSWDVVEYAVNKKLTYAIAKENNIPIPQTIFPENLDDLNDAIDDIVFPVIIKPAVMHIFYEKTKTKVIKVATKEELIQEYMKVSSIIDPSQIMIQEIIPGSASNLYSFCSFFKHGEPFGVFTGKRSRQRPMDFGKSSTFVESTYVPELEELGARLLNAMSYYGLSEIEFKRDPRDGKFKLLEMNARTWLWHSLTIRCGVDFSYLLYKDLIGEEITPITSFRENVKWMHIYTDLGVVIKEIIKGNMGLRDFIISLKGEKEFAVFSWDDLSPFIGETLILPYLWKTR